jgi:hypothetical protein
MFKADFDDTFIDEPLDEFVIMYRDSNGVSTNVPHIVLHHSDRGYEWGSIGAGPADFALNIVENLLRQIGYVGPTMIDTWSKNTVFVKSWELHQEFLADIVAEMPFEGGMLFVNELIIWVKGRSY